MNTDLLITIFVAAFLVFAFLYALRKNKGEGSSVQKMTKSKFTVDLSQLAEKGGMDPFTGREDEIDRAIHIIMRRSKNNPLLIGQPGVGKTAIVEGLAARIAEKEVPSALYEKRVLSLDLTALVSETKYRGELEARLKAVIDQLESLKGRAILFIDEIHMLQQIGQSEGSLNISDVLKPALARGDVQVIGATTWSEYEKYIQPDQALDRRFQAVLVDEPSQEEAIQILMGLRKTYEEFHSVKISNKAIEAAVRLSDELIKDRYLPDKAIDLIDEAAAKVAIEASYTRKVAMGLVHAASKGQDKSVNEKDIKEVADQWLIHSKADAKRDARKDEK